VLIRQRGRFWWSSNKKIEEEIGIKSLRECLTSEQLYVHWKL
jgi:hypothetical protein